MEPCLVKAVVTDINGSKFYYREEMELDSQPVSGSEDKLQGDYHISIIPVPASDIADRRI